MDGGCCSEWEGSIVRDVMVAVVWDPGWDVAEVLFLNVDEAGAVCSLEAKLVVGGGIGGRLLGGST